MRAIELNEQLSVRGSSTWRRLSIGIVILYMLFLILAPIVTLIVGALSRGLPPIFSALSDPDVLSAFWRTLQIALLTILIHTICGTAVAWMLVRDRFRGLPVINAFIDLPFAVSPVVAGYMLLLLFGRTGLFAPLMDKFHLTIAFAMPGMILATLFVTLPFMVRELVPVLHAFGTEQEQAAATLGASGWQSFRLVTFPALRWGFIYGLTLTFARALGEFGAVLVIGGGIQGRTETATIYIFRALDDWQYVGAYSAALLLGLVSLVLVLGAEALRHREK